MSLTSWLCVVFVLTRGRTVGPSSTALHECGAPDADASEFWAVNGDRSRHFPVANTDFRVNKSPDRQTRMHEDVRRQWGVRFGGNASGAYANHFVNPPYIPPALRRSSPREVLGFLCAGGQIGSPAPIHTDLRLGYSAMGYQSWQIASISLEARNFILIRI